MAGRIRADRVTYLAKDRVPALCQSIASPRLHSSAIWANAHKDLHSLYRLISQFPPPQLSFLWVAMETWHPPTHFIQWHSTQEPGKSCCQLVLTPEGCKWASVRHHRNKLPTKDLQVAIINVSSTKMDDMRCERWRVWEVCCNSPRSDDMELLSADCHDFCKSLIRFDFLSLYLLWLFLMCLQISL